MPCDTSNNEHLFEYNMILNDISKCCIDNSISNCIIGGDMNTDTSRICSGNTISPQKFVAEENLSLALSTVDNSVEHTYIGVNNSTSLIDHFIVSNSIHTNLLDYYTKDSVDNLLDHIPVCINITRIVETVPNNPQLVMHSKPVWGLVQPDHKQKYQDELNELNELLYNFLPTDEMFMSSVNDSLCLKKKHITEFHDNISTAS